MPRGSRFGDLRLTGFVGRGGFADVYEAFDARGRRLAVKVLRLVGVEQSGQQARITREREILMRVDSRGVARLVASDLTSDTPWIASEFVDGPTLRESVASDGPLSRDETLAFIRHLAGVLADLHAGGIAHRDITPNNVMFGPDGPVLVDFGSARADFEGDASGSLLLVGTQGYTPPEAIRGERVGRSADIYGLARLAQFSLTGSDEGDANLPDVLRRALAADPADRPSASEIAAELPVGTTLPARHVQRVVAKLPRRFRVRSLAAAALVVGSVAAGLTWWLAAQDRIVTVSEVVGGEIGSPDARSSGPLLRFSELPPDWEVVRRRPADTTLGYDLGTLSSWELTLGERPGPDDPTRAYALAEVTLSIRDLNPVNTLDPADGMHLSGELLERADKLVDRFEVLYLRNGCTLVRADRTALRPDGSLLWAAGVDGCGGDPDRRQAVGLLWHPSSNLVVEWFVDSSQVPGPSTTVGSLDLLAGFQIPVLDPGVTLDQMVGLDDLKVQVETSDSNESIVFAIGVLEIPAESAVRFESTESSEAQVSFMVTQADNPGDVPEELASGRWWLRGGGEARSISNPFESPVTLIVEIDGLWADAKVGLEIEPTTYSGELLDLDRSLSVAVPESANAELQEAARSFLLPSVPPESADWSPVPITYSFGDVTLDLTTALIPLAYANESNTQVLRSDDTLEDWELSWMEAHDPHLLIASSPEFEFIIGMEASDWTMYSDLGGCQSESLIRITTAQSIIQVRGALDCRILDSIDSSEFGNSGPQAAPIFRFTVGERDGYEQHITGSFVPESREDFAFFLDFLRELVEKADGLDPSQVYSE